MDEPHEKELYRRLLDAWTKPREEERQRGDASRFLLALGDFHQRMVVGTRDREIARKPSIWSLEKTLWAAVLAIESGRTPPFSVLTQSEYVFPFSRDSPLFQLWLDALKESGLLALENQVNRDETDGKDDDS